MTALLLFGIHNDRQKTKKKSKIASDNCEVLFALSLSEQNVYLVDLSSQYLSAHAESFLYFGLQFHNFYLIFLIGSNYIHYI